MSESQHMRTRERAPRRDREQPRQSRDEEAEDYYRRNSFQDGQRRPRRAREGSGQSVIKLPSFHGKNNEDIYLEWERKVERAFEYQHYSENNKMRIAASSFYDYALSWWDQLVISRKRYGESPVETWTEMKAIMRKRHAPKLQFNRSRIQDDFPKTGGNFVKTKLKDPFIKSNERGHFLRPTMHKEDSGPARIPFDRSQLQVAKDRPFKSQEKTKPTSLEQNQEVTKISVDSFQSISEIFSSIIHLSLPKGIDAGSKEKLEELLSNDDLIKAEEHKQKEEVSNEITCENKSVSPSNSFESTGEDKRALILKQPVLKFIYKETLLSFTNLASVLPSEKPCHFQDFRSVVLREKSSDLLLPICDIERPIAFEPEAHIETNPCDIRNKQGKEIIVADAIIQRYAFLFVPEAKLLEFEHIKMLCNSNDNFKNVFPSCEEFEHKKFFRHGGFLFDKDKFCEPSYSVLMNIDKFSKPASASHNAELFFGEIVYFDSILNFSNKLDYRADHIKFVLDDLSGKLFASRNEYILCTYDLLSRVFAVSIQDIQDGELSLCKKTTRKKVLVTSNALIQEEPPDPTPLLTVIMSTKQTNDHIQVSNTSCLMIHFVSHDSTAVRMSLLNPEIIEKNIGLLKEHLESNYYLRMQVNERHDKDNALIKAEKRLLVFSDSMTVITHLFFAKSAESVAGTKEEPPDLEVLSFSFFVRTGIGVNLMQEKKPLAYFRMVFEVGEKVSAKTKINLNPTPKTDGPFMINKKITGDYTYLRGKYKENSIFKVAYSLLPFIADQTDLRSNLFQEREDDVILPSNMEKKLVAELDHGAKDELEPEEALKMPIGLLLQDIHTHKDHLSHGHVFEPHWSHYMLKKDSKWGMAHKHSFSLISDFVPLGFSGEVFNEAYDPYIFIMAHYAIEDLSRPIYLHHFVAQDMRRKENDLKSHFEFKLSFNYFSVFRV